MVQALAEAIGVALLVVMDLDTSTLAVPDHLC
jgi:hypothetical protein